MPEYLVLLKLDSKSLRDAIRRLRSLPEKPRPGVKLCYTMDIFGDWDLGLLINTNNEDNALDFLNESIDEIPGVVRAYVLSGSPHRQMQKTRKQ
jgi:DNA-binding Lrp family transcriptional regulator